MLQSEPDSGSPARYKGLKKPDKNIPVLTGVDFQVKTGSIFALLGSNGGQFTAVDEILTGRENLIMIGRLRHLKKNPRQVADDLLNRKSL